jgi:hypothetical protein
VTHRSFKDREGKHWDVWIVHPSAAERRFVDRRAKELDQAGAAERRGKVDRRGGVRKSPRASVAEEFAHGWLCFEARGEKRRLAPVPELWDRADDTALEEWCSMATPALRRNTGAGKKAP